MSRYGPVRYGVPSEPPKLNADGVFFDSQGRPRDSLGNHAAHTIPGYSNQPDKGQRLGSCNRTACQRPMAVALHSNGKWYCLTCAFDLNNANRGQQFWKPLTIDQDALTAVA